MFDWNKTDFGSALVPLTEEQEDFIDSFFTSSKEEENKYEKS